MSSDEMMHVKEIVLRQVQATTAVRTHMSAQMVLDVCEYDYGKQLVMALRSWVVGEPVADRTIVVQWFEPKNDWQRLRRRLGWQYKSKVLTKKVDVTKYVVFPDMEPKPEWFGKPVVKYCEFKAAPWRI
jgi:hypothetical protein